MSHSSNSNRLLLRVHRPGGTQDEYYAAPGLTIGRSVANTVVLPDDSTVDQMHHARVELSDDGGLRLCCPDPTSILQIDGRSCREVILAAGLKVRIGNSELECLSRHHSTVTPSAEKNSDCSSCPFCDNTRVPLDGTDPRPCPDCGRNLLPVPFENESTGLVGLDFGSYVAQRFVARGGMGLVLAGHHRETHAAVAIKLLLDQNPSDSARERFCKEAAHLAQVRHTNVVGVIDSGTAEGRDYLVMDWIDGCSLADRLRTEVSDYGGLPFEQVRSWIVQVCHGLAAIHAQGIVHRDLKPANILVDGQGIAHVADFGLAKQARPNVTSLTQTGQTPGTFHYMAPEQFDCPNLVDPRTDLYALGVTTYELLTGTFPLGTWRPASRINKTVPVQFDQLLYRLLETDPSRRVPSAADLLGQLDSVVAAAAVPALPLGPGWDQPIPFAAIAIAGSIVGLSVGLLCALMMGIDWRFTALIGAVVGAIASGISRPT